MRGRRQNAESYSMEYAMEDHKWITSNNIFLVKINALST